MEVPFFVFTGPITPEELEIRRTLGLIENPHKVLTEDDMMKCVLLEKKVDHVTDVPLDKNTGISNNLNITNTKRRSNQNLSLDSKYISTIHNIVKSRNSHSFYSPKNVKSTPNSFLQDFNLTYDSTQQKSPNVTVRGESVSNVESFIEGFDRFQEASHKPIKRKKVTLMKKLMNKKYKYSKNNISNDKSRSSHIKSNSQIFLKNISTVEESDFNGDLSKQETSHNESISIRGEPSHQSFKQSTDFVDVTLDNKEKSSIRLKSLRSQGMNEEPSQVESDINFGNLSKQDKISIKNKSLSIKDDECSLINGSGYKKSMSTRDKSVDLTAKKLDVTVESVGKKSILRKSVRTSTGSCVTQGVNFEDHSQMEESNVNFTLGEISSMEKSSIKRKSTQNKKNSQIKPDEHNTTLLQSSRKSTRDKSNVDLTAKNLSKVEESKIDATVETLGKSSIRRKSSRTSGGVNVTQGLNFEGLSQLEESNVNFTFGEMSNMENSSIQRKSTQNKRNSQIEPDETSVYEKCNSTLLESSRKSTRDKSNVDLTAKNLSKIEESEIDATVETIGKSSICRKSSRTSGGVNVTQGLNFEGLSQLEESNVNFTLGEMSSMENSSIQRKSTQNKKNSQIKPDETSVYDERNSTLLQSSRRSTRNKSNVDLTAKNLSKVEESEMDETFESVAKSLRTIGVGNVTQGLTFEGLSQLEESNANFALADMSSMEKSSIQRKSTQNKRNSQIKPDEPSGTDESNNTLLQSSRRSTRDKSNVDLTAKNLSKVEESSTNFTLGDISSIQKRSIQRQSTQNKENSLVILNETSRYDGHDSTLLQSSGISTRDKSNVELTAKNLSKVEESEVDETFESIGNSSIRRKSLRTSGGGNVTQSLNFKDTSQLEESNVNFTHGDISSMENSSIQRSSTQNKKNSQIKHDEANEYEKCNSSMMPSSRRSTRDKSNVELTAKNLSKVEEPEVDETFESIGKSSLRRKSLRTSREGNVTQGLNFEDISQLEESNVNFTLGDISSMEKSSMQRKSTQNKRNSQIVPDETSVYEKCNSTLLQSSRRSTRDQSNVELTAKKLSIVEEPEVDETFETRGKSSIRRKSLRTSGGSNVTQDLNFEDMSQLETSNVNFTLGDISSMDKSSIQRKSTQNKRNSQIEPDETSVYENYNSTLLQSSRRSTKDKSNVDLTAKNLSKLEEPEMDESLESIGKSSLRRKSLRTSGGGNVTIGVNFEDLSQMEESNVNFTLGEMSSMENSSIQRKSTQNKKNSQIKPDETSVYDERNCTLLQSTRRSTRNKSNVDLTAKNLSKVEESEMDETFESVAKSLRTIGVGNVTQGLTFEGLSQLEESNANFTLADMSSMEKSSIQRKSIQKKRNSQIKPDEPSGTDESNNTLLQSSRRSTRDKSNVDLTAKNLSKVEESSINFTLGDISSIQKRSIQRQSTQNKENSLVILNETSRYDELTGENLSKVEESEVDETFESIGNSSIRRKSLRTSGGGNVTQSLNFKDTSQLEEPKVNFTLGDISGMEKSSIQRSSTQNKKNSQIKHDEANEYEKCNSSMMPSSRRSTRDKSNVELTAKNLSKVEEPEVDETFESIGKSSLRRKSLRTSREGNVTQGLNFEDISQLEESNVNFTLGDISSMEKSSMQRKSTQNKRNSQIEPDETSVYEKCNSTLLQSSRRSTKDKSNVDLTAKNLSKLEEPEMDESLESIGKSSLRRKSLRTSGGGNVTIGVNFEDHSQMEESNVNFTLEEISSMEKSSIQRKSTQNKKNSQIKPDETSVYDERNSTLPQSSRKSTRDKSNVDLTAKNLSKVEESEIDVTVKNMSKSSIRRKSSRTSGGVNVAHGLNFEGPSQLEESHVNFTLGDMSSMENSSIQRKSTQNKNNSLIKPNETSDYDERNSTLVPISRSSTRDNSSVELTAINLSKVEESEIDETFESIDKRSIPSKSIRGSPGDLNFEDMSQLEDVNLTLVDLSSLENSSIQRNSAQNKKNNIRKSTRGKERSLNAQSEHNATPKQKTSQIRFLNVDRSSKVKESDIDSTLRNESNMEKSLMKSTRRMERSLNMESEQTATPKRKISQISYLNVDKPTKVKESDIDSTVENDPNMVKSLRKITRDLERSLNAEPEHSATPKRKVSQISYMNVDEPSKVKESDIDSTVENEPNMIKSLRKSTRDLERSLNAESEHSATTPKRKISYVNVEEQTEVKDSCTDLTHRDLEKSSIIGHKSRKSENTELFATETPSLDKSRVENIPIRKKSLRKSSQVCELSSLQKSSSLQLSTSAKSDLFLMAENQSKVKESDIDSTLENEQNMGRSLRKSTRGKENSLNESELYFTPKPKISQLNEDQKLQNLVKSSFKKSPLLEIPRRSTRGSNLFLMSENQSKVEESNVANEVKLEKSLLKSSQGIKSCYIDLNFTPSNVQKSSRSANSEKDLKAENQSNVEKSDIYKLNIEENKNTQNDLSSLIDFDTPKIEPNGQKYKKSLQKSARRSTRAKTILDLTVEESEISSGIISKLKTPKSKICNDPIVEEPSQYFTHGKTSIQRKNSKKSSLMELNFTPVSGISDKSTPFNGKERFPLKKDNKSLVTPSTSNCLKRKSKFDESLIHKKSCLSTSSKNNFLTPSNAIPIKQASSQSKIPIFNKSQVSTLNTTSDLSKSESRIPKIKPPSVYSPRFFLNKK